MLHCAHCKHRLSIADAAIYREFGDFVIDCSHCTAHNVVVPHTDKDTSQPTPLLEITGYHAVA